MNPKEVFGFIHSTAFSQSDAPTTAQRGHSEAPNADVGTWVGPVRH